MAELSVEEVEAIAEAAPVIIEGLNKMQVAFVALGSAIAGATVSFVALRKKLEKKYAERADEEIAQMQEHYRAKSVAAEEKPDLEKVVQDLGYAEAKLKDSADPGAPNVAPPAEVLEETKNVFQEQVDARLEEVDPNEGWDYDIERASRDPKFPYVIHIDEQDEKPGYTDATFTYYEGDDVLCDARDKIVDNRDEIVGDFLEKFGHGSNDPNVVYIRNDALGCVIEICRSPNTYAEEVHGFKHSDEPVVRFPRRRELDDE